MAYTLNFQDGPVDGVDVLGSRTKMWASYHNWRDSFKATYEFSTEILVSRSGREQRIAHRLVPRKTLTFSRQLHGATFRALNDLLWSWQHRTFILPELTRKIVLEDGMVPGSTTLSISGTVPDWLQAEANVMLMYQDLQEIRVVQSVVGGVVTFKSATSTLWPEHTLLYYAVAGYLDASVQAPRKTNNTAVATLPFNVVPLSEPYIAPGNPTGPVLNGREIFDKRPNWASDIAVSTEHDVDTVDYGRGPVARFFPVPYGRMLRTHSFVSRSPEEAEAVLKFFHRQYGRQGEFYMPTWDADIVAAATANAGTQTLRIKGRIFYDAYWNSTVHKALVVRLNSGDPIYRTINSITLVSDTEGLDTLITIDGTWPSEIRADNTVAISWLLAWRFASDLLTIEHLTTTVAQFQLAFQSLEDLTPETF